MPKARTKQFRLSDEYQLFAVDCWWAELLHKGLKEIVEIEWEALGEQIWVLRVHWRPVKGNLKLNVGHPKYVDMSSEDLDEITQDLLTEFEEGLDEYNVLGTKVQQWGVSGLQPDEDGDRRLSFRRDLDPAEKIIATDFLWGRYLEIGRWLKMQRTKLRELNREREVREMDDYYPVTVDRGMLRSAFVDQMGYDNEWLFEDVEEHFSSGEE